MKVREFYTEKEWDKVQKKNREEEYAYFLFSIRLISYGLGSVFLTLFFLVKLSINMVWYHYFLVLMFVLCFVFIDQIIKFVAKK